MDLSTTGTYADLDHVEQCPDADPPLCATDPFPDHLHDQDLWWARGLGHTPLGGGAELGLADAELLQAETAGPDGRTTLGFPVPSDWTGRTVWLQVWDGATLSLPNAVDVR